MPIHLPPINRRRFLAGSLAAGAGLLLPQFISAEESAVKTDHFLLLSDNHIGSRRDDIMDGMKPAETFEQACRDILQLPNLPQQAIVSGDCAIREGRPGDYAYYGELLKPLRGAGMSFHLALGNHDHRQNFLAAFPDAKSAASEKEVPNKYFSIVETTYANWFLLDSLEKTTASPGMLGHAQLAWLAKSLDARPNKPALIVAHHHLDPVIQYKGLQDTWPLLHVLLARKHVKAYIFGHTHLWCHGRLFDLNVVNLPTTAGPSEQRGFVTATLRPDGATFHLHALDPKNRMDGDKVELKWQT